MRKLMTAALALSILNEPANAGCVMDESVTDEAIFILPEVRKFELTKLQAYVILFDPEIKRNYAVKDMPRLLAYQISKETFMIFALTDEGCLLSTQGMILSWESLKSIFDYFGDPS